MWLCLAMLVVQCADIRPDDVAQAELHIPDEIDYNFHIKPILSDRCFICHGPDEKQLKGDLRLDFENESHKHAMNESSKKAFVIKPGNIDKSEVVSRILSEDPAYMMPPPESHLALDATEKAIMLRWIEQGAEYKEHWSFDVPMVKSLPDVQSEEWANNDIDRFILKELEENGLEPSDRADAVTRLRRLTLDLTGLPPDQDEIAAFMADSSDQAYEAAIDRLLASPHYGERMALDWLDIARYADSHGYQDDGMRNTWPWRDWVIESFNRNLPYDTFLLWQLAGDLLPEPTTEQLLATCFNRNHPQTQEGGVIDEEYRVEYVADRTNTFGKALIGLTMECARCHDHKYDPISQKDYYSLYAYFNNNNDSGIVPYDGEASPTIILPSDSAKYLLDSLHTEMELVEGKMDRDHFRQEFEQWVAGLSDTGDFLKKVVSEDLVADFDFEAEVRKPVHQIEIGKKPNRKPKDGEAVNYTMGYVNKVKNRVDARVWGHMDDRPVIDEGMAGHGLRFDGDAGIQFNRDLDFDRHQPFTISLWIRLLKHGEEGPLFGKTNGEFEGYRGYLCKLNEDGTLSFQINHVWPDNCIDFQTTDTIPVNEWVHLVMTYDGSSKADGVNFYMNGEVPEHTLFADNLHKSILHGSDGTNWNDTPFAIGKEFRKSMSNIVMDELKIYTRPLVAAEVRELYGMQGHHTLEDQELMSIYLNTGRSRQYIKYLNQLTAIRARRNQILTDQPEVMIMKERKYPRKTYVLDRGVYDAHGEEVHAEVPDMLQIDGVEFAKDRLGLAKWLIHEKNPLTARVAVNRLWAVCFGEGLVSTQEDFGSQGNLPTHPDLLDYLALRFIELDWNMKAMIKEICLSATYQQSSKVKYPEKDPENKYLSYYPSSRLPAEIIRDQALAASGLLVPQLGGPSVYPYQPTGIWKALATRNATEYHQQSGDSLYRRSLYTIWKRSAPPPSMLNFDAPDRYYCTVRRQNTSTPLQSLVLMNDPQFVESARVLAEQMVLTADTETGIKLAFQALLGRYPRNDELEALVDLYQSAFAAYEKDPEEAQELLHVGEHPVNDELDQLTLAANTLIASTVMNYDEFVMKR